VGAGQSIAAFAAALGLADQTLQNSFYNAKRLHSTLGYVSRMQFEKNWLAEQERRYA
jgi:hypothetical protein